MPSSQLTAIGSVVADREPKFLRDAPRSRTNEVAAVDPGCSFEYLLDRVPRAVHLNDVATNWLGRNAGHDPFDLARPTLEAPAGEGERTMGTDSTLSGTALVVTHTNESCQ